jgi:hypothetical protein
VIRRWLVGFSTFLTAGLFCIATAAVAQLGGVSSSVVGTSRTITRAQLGAYFEESSLLTEQKQRLQAQLEASRRKVPAWMPRDVWSDFQRRVMTIDPVQMALPVYQRYFSEEDVAAFLLLYDGPTGHALGEAIHQPGQVQGAAQQEALREKVAQLRQKRLDELTPEQRATILQAQQRMAAKPNTARRIDDEQNLALQRRFDDVWVKTLIAHRTELAAAHSSYNVKH